MRTTVNQQNEANFASTIVTITK